jgi:hypothetical protein
MRELIAVGLLVACTPRQPPPPPPPNLVATTPVDGRLPIVAIDAPVATASDAAPVEPEPPPPADTPSIAVPDPVPPVKGPVTRIATNATVTITGIKITFKYSSHKSGGELGMWGFEAVRFGAKKQFELRSETSGFEAELDVTGTLLVFRHVDYNTFEIVLAAPKAPKPLDDDGCSAQIEKAATDRKLPTGGSSSSSTDHGIVKMSTASWVAYCGQYTRRIWFAPPREPRKKERW